VRKLLWTGAVAGSLALLLLAFLGVVDGLGRRPYAPPGVPPEPEPPGFRVGVLGDAQKGLANLRNIAAAVEREKVRLLLQTGDMVANNDDGHYLLARRYLAKGGSFSWPVIAPGNHDLKGGDERFQLQVGPLERSFTVDGVAFVLVNNAFGKPIPTAAHLEERIAAAGPHKAVVLAMHQAPFDVQGQAKPEYAEFLSWLERSKVNYLLCGHEHAYLRKKVGDTTVIINGVGGDFDTWQLDQKVYATILEINGSTISDRSLELQPVHEVWENIEHLAIGHVGEAYRRKPLACWGGTLLLAGGVAWALRRIFAAREPFARPAG
jgi:3',5'-cyclic AMP phosphodiesterase CpdA